MKLIVDIEMNAALFLEAEKTPQHVQDLVFLLSRAKISPINMPLEAKVCTDFNLKKNPDYPIAALSASADGNALESSYWFRAEPVHLVMQRDAFSLGENVPLQVSFPHATALLSTLNQHFKEDGLQFVAGNSGTWYLKVQPELGHFFPVSTTLPQVAIGKNIHHFMPQGKAAQKWRSILNEIQMLLHDHPINLMRESDGQQAVNSIWLSGGGIMPAQISQPNEDLIFFADSPFYEGLASFVHAPYALLPDHSESILQKHFKQVRMQLAHEKQYLWLSEILKMLKSKKITMLTLNIGCYEKTLETSITHRDLYKFWRKTKSLRYFLDN